MSCLLLTRPKDLKKKKKKKKKKNLKDKSLDIVVIFSKTYIWGELSFYPSFPLLTLPGSAVITQMCFNRYRIFSHWF